MAETKELASETCVMLSDMPDDDGVHKWPEKSPEQDEDATSRTSLMDDSTSHHDSTHHRRLGNKKMSLRFALAPGGEEEEKREASEKSFEEEEEDATLPILEPFSAARSSFKKHRVSFQNIEIREYAIIPGDNPAVTMGVPLTIDWTPLEKVSCELDKYELDRPQPPRTMIELRMPMLRRYHLLQKLQFSRNEINHHAKQATLARNNRKRTDATMHLEPMQERFERWWRALANATWNRSKKQQEKQWLQHCSKFSTSANVKLESCLKDRDRTFEVVYDDVLQPPSRATSTESLSRSRFNYFGSIVRAVSTASGKNAGGDDGRSKSRRHKKVPNSIKRKEREKKRRAKQADQLLKRQSSILQSIEHMERLQQQQGQRLMSHRRNSKTQESIELWSHVKSKKVQQEGAQVLTDESIIQKYQAKKDKKKTELGQVVREYSLTRRSGSGKKD
jgi:hypothetical protein